MIFIIAAYVVLLLWLLVRVGRRSGVSDKDLTRKLAGDDIMPGHTITVDRATVIAAPVEIVWPWVMQLGKRRAGWYAPRWIEWFVPKAKRGARTVIPAFQKLAVGDTTPDWGPGSLKVLELQSNKHLIYGSIKTTAPDKYLFSWALILEPVDATHCRFYIRLRMKRPKNPALRLLLHTLGGFFDYLTIVVMFAGLKQRVQKH